MTFFTPKPPVPRSLRTVLLRPLSPDSSCKQASHICQLDHFGLSQHVRLGSMPSWSLRIRYGSPAFLVLPFPTHLEYIAHASSAIASEPCVWEATHWPNSSIPHLAANTFCAADEVLQPGRLSIAILPVPHLLHSLSSSLFCSILPANTLIPTYIQKRFLTHSPRKAVLKCLKVKHPSYYPVS